MFNHQKGIILFIRMTGTIYGIDRLKPEIQIEETIDENMVGLVYILAKIMYHQDDVFMV